MSNRQVVSYAFSKSKTKTRRLRVRRESDSVFQVQKMVYSESVLSESTLSIWYEIPPLQDPDKPTIHHSLHGLTNKTSQNDEPLTSSEWVTITQLQYWDDCWSLQKKGTQLSVHTRQYKTEDTPCRYMKDETPFRYGYLRGKETSRDSLLRLREAHPW